MSPSNTEKETVQKRQNYICQYCGKDGLASLDAWHDCSVDHFVPTKQEGTDNQENLVTSCGLCNSIKAGRRFGSMEEARAFIAERRVQKQQDFLRVKAEVRCHPPA